MLSDIKTEIKNYLSAVPDVYNVFTKAKYSLDTNAVISTFSATTILGKAVFTAWFISRKSSFEVYFSTSQNLRTHTIIISGYFAINESINTPDLFENIIEDICSHFRAITPSADCFNLTPITVLNITEKNLANVLCHYVELELKYTERVNILIGN